MYDERNDLPVKCSFYDLHDANKFMNFDKELFFEDLLVPIFINGKQVYEKETIDAIRNVVLRNKGKFPKALFDFFYEYKYNVCISVDLYETKDRLIRNRDALCEHC